MKLRSVTTVTEKPYISISGLVCFISVPSVRALGLRSGMGMVIGQHPTDKTRFFAHFADIVADGYYELKHDNERTEAMHVSAGANAMNAGLKTGKYYLDEKVIDKETLNEYYELIPANS